MTDFVQFLPREQVVLVDAVKDALLARAGIYGVMLKLAEHVGHIEQSGEQLLPVMENLELSNEELCEMQMGAYAWCEQVSRQA